MNPANPTILSLETSSDVGSIAIHKAGTLIAGIEHHIHGLHDQMLTSMVQSLLHVCHLKLSDIQAIAIGKGPGSYTGMRIGSSFVKGLCYSNNLPLIAISTLETLLQRRLAHPKDQNLWCALINARRGRAYALLQDQAKNSLLKEPIVEVTTATFSHWLQQKRITFIGSGAEHYAHQLIHKHSYIIKGHYPKAHDMGQLAYDAWIAEKWENLGSFSPIYIGAGVHS